MYFLNATNRSEAVRAFVKEPRSDATTRSRTWIEGMTGCEWTEAPRRLGKSDRTEALISRPPRSISTRVSCEFRRLRSASVREVRSVSDQSAIGPRAGPEVITERSSWYTKPRMGRRFSQRQPRCVQYLYSQSIRDFARQNLEKAVGPFAQSRCAISTASLGRASYRVGGSISPRFRPPRPRKHVVRDMPA